MARQSNISKPTRPIGPPVPNAGEHTSAYFRSLSVKNIRCFGEDEQTLNLSDKRGDPAHWTVILGNNGTGKTTLLECLAAFHGATSGDLFGFNPSIIGFRWAVKMRDHHLIRAGDAATGEAAKLDAKFAYGRLLNRGRAAWLDTVRTLNLQPSSGGASQSGVSGHPCPFCCCYGAARKMRTTSLRDEGSDDPTSSLYDDLADLRNAEEWLLQLDYSASKRSPIQREQAAARESVRKLLIDILPDVEDIRFAVPSSDEPRPTVEFKTPDGWLPLRYAGLGYRTAMAWIVDFASRLVERYPNSTDPLSEAAVALVDEIDLHLHPKWQRILMRHLSDRFPNVQFIVTAHSPLFVQAAEGANLVVLRREKDRVRIDNDVEAIRGWRVDQLLTRDLFELPSARPPRLDKLLEERRKLLTKGKLTAADRHRLEKLSDQIGALPGGETAEDAKTRALLERALNELRRSGAKG